MKMFKRDKAQGEETKLTIRHMVGDREIPMNRAGRKSAEAQIRKLIARTGSLIHPETKEQPEIVLFQEKAGFNDVQLRLKTDSEGLRAWYKERGLNVHGEVVADAPAPQSEPAGA